MYSDGGSRGNPGESGSGFVIKNSKNEIISSGYKYLGIATNNEAEWDGLIIGLTEAIKLGIKELHVIGDSKLVINQVQNKWKVKAENLKKFHTKSQKLLTKFSKITFKHVLREFNKDADRMANMAMDTKESLVN